MSSIGAVPPSVLVISATRLARGDFLRETLLGRSLALHSGSAALRAQIAFENSEGLPAVYNRALDAARDEDIVIFCHDDVALDDAWLVERLQEALAQYELVGVAGMADPDPEHASWSTGFWRRDAQGALALAGLDRLAGRVRHQVDGRDWVQHYGPAPRAVDLLDGSFLAAHAGTLRRAGLRFDERFGFHFYDLDLCRQARARGLRLGVWPISITHGSTGDYDSPEWQAGLARYREKWPPGEARPVPVPPPPSLAAAAEAFNAANADFRASRWAEALAGYEAALHQAPDLAGAALQKARCLVRLERGAAAREAFAQALRQDPQDYSAWLEAGHLCRQQGELQQAAAAYARALALAPQRHEAPLALFRALDQAGQREAAEQALARAVVNATERGGAVLADTQRRAARYRLERGDAAGAQALLAAALRGQAHEANDQAELQVDLAESLLRQGRTAEAQALLGQASAATREGTLARLAELSFRHNFWAEAIELCRRNTALHPTSASAHWNLAQLLTECWQMNEGLRVLAEAERLAPMPGAGRLRASVASRTGDADTALEFYRAELARPGAGVDLASSAAMCALYSDRLSSTEVATLHRELFYPLGRGARPADSFPREPLAGRRLRLGIVAADFHRQHPVNLFMQPVLRELDRGRIELSVYFVGVSHDAQTQLARERAEHWVEATYLNDSQLARRIDADRIDLLLDLSGHTGHQRMALFGQRAAPVQCTYLGYPGSTGVPNVDWLLADAVVAPPGCEALYSERVWRLPGQVFCYAPEEAYPAPRFGPAQAGRPLTFGSFNNVPKLTPRTLRLWAAVLKAVPGSRLLLKAPSFGDTAAVTIFRDKLAALGVAPERLEFRGPSGLADMMAEYADVDIALDPSPYNGGTTSLQALWMGAPVLTLAGGHFVSRMGASFMQAAGLAEWVAADEAQYVAIARAMAEDREALRALKNGLRERLLARPAWDVVAHTRALEAAFLAMAGAQS